ncbi:MAG: hypothetical protein P4L85_08705 [Paludisphaera borealis]|uniref:PEP-CTERM sorting domain-containing protein n=1 Tax=Paludisphaera borealis TaxID=1387353 RepID=UPI00285116D0|nr:PEP-CTERM sorting domain-containing protein [Paludisphaera borealis]MDR3619416.1 hypothetical protein [Paludisphaera borealis]
MVGSLVRRLMATAALIGLGIVSAERADAAVTTYTSSAAFTAGLGGLAVATENYSGFTAGNVINAGDSFNGLTYSAFTAGPSGTLLGGDITSLYNSFSGLSLGGRQSGGAQFFFGGDSFTVTFATPVNALGIFFNVNPNSGNYGISTSVGNAVTGSAGYDTSTFVFAGLISTTSFSSATIYSTDARLGVYNIPEIVTAAVPEPSALAMGLLGMVSMGGAVLRSRRVVR